MKTFSLSIHGKQADLCLHNPMASNGFGPRELKALQAALQEIKRQPSLTGLLWHSQGRMFCSGGDLKQLKALSLANRKRFHQTMAKTLDQLFCMPLRKVAVVEGDCLGGGLEILSCFDHVVAAPHVMLGAWQGRIGLTYGWGGERRLQLKSGPRPLSLIHDSRLVSVDRAFDLGLIDEISLHPKQRASVWLKHAERWTYSGHLLRKNALNKTPLAIERKDFNVLLAKSD